MPRCSSERRHATSRPASRVPHPADRPRLRLLARSSAEGPLSSTALVAGTHVTRQAITKYLRRMQDAGILSVTTQGRERVWDVEPDALDAAQRYLRAIADQWDADLGRLKQFVER